ncbi:MAG: glycerol-3-phosphate 1-O-acyltransferase PlsY [Prochlorotrichaceae cyanobacterium]
MTNLFILVGTSLFAYLLGSFPTGYLLVRSLKGLDIRTLGSGSTGATNVLRVAGKVPAAIVFGVDLAKGVAAVLLSGTIAQSSGLDADWIPAIQCGGGLLALLGHSKPLWLKFKGGKSVATGLGVLFALNWVIALGALGCFGLTLGAFRMVSLGSIVAAIAGNALMWTTGQPLAYKIFAFLGGSYVIWLHKSNIQRLRSGTEPRIGQTIVSPAEASGVAKADSGLPSKSGQD